MLHHEIIGTPAPDRPLLCWLHGFMGASSEWTSFAERLSDLAPSLCVDLPGHGQSAAAQPCDLDAAVEGLQELLAVYPSTSLILIGYSLGGRVAMSYAARFPQTLRGLVIESAHPGLTSARERAARYAHDSSLAAKLTNEPFEAFLCSWYQQSVFASLAKDPDARARMMHQHRQQNDPAALARALQGMSLGQQDDLRPEISALKCPVLLLAGEGDSKYLELYQAWQGAWPDPFALEEICGAGHNAHAAQPERVAELLRNFILTTL